MGKLQIQRVEVNHKEQTVVPIDETFGHEITALTPFQYMSVSKILHNMLQKLKEDQSVQKLIQQIADSIDEDSSWQDILRVGGSELIDSGLGSVSFLLDVVPEEFMDLISVASGIEKNTLLSQDMDKFFDIVDECIEVNNIQGLVDRLKKSGKSLAKKVNFQKLTQEATAATQRQ